MNSAWTNGNDYKNTLSVDFKVIPLAVANYDNGLLLSADIGYRTDGTSNIMNFKGIKIKELEGKYRYDSNLDDFLWKVSADVEAVKYRGRGSLYWNWGENLALGGTIKDFGLSITNNKRFILGEGCILGGKLTPSFMELAECPKLTSSCASKLELSKNTLIANGFMFGMKSQPRYESRFSASDTWTNPFPYLEADIELGFKIIMDEKVKKGNSNKIQFSDPIITSNLAGSGLLSIKIPKSKSKYFPFPTKNINLLELCVGMSPLDIKYYYNKGLFVNTAKVENIKGLFGFYGKASIADKEAMFFYSWIPFKIKDSEEEQTWLYGTNFKIEIKDTVSTRRKRQKTFRSVSSSFNMTKNIEGENIVETLIIPENNSGPLILVKSITNIEIITPLGDIINKNNMDDYQEVVIEAESDSITIGLHNPKAGIWKFKFKNTPDYEFLVFSDNQAPIVETSILKRTIEYGSALSLNLNYQDIDSPRGFVKVVAKNNNGKELILFDENITTPYNESINLYLSEVGDFNLSLFTTDGLRGYSEIPLGTIRIKEPSSFIADLMTTTGKNSIVAEWKSLNVVNKYDITLLNKTTSNVNKYDEISSSFSKTNLVDGEYILTVDARYNGNIVQTLTSAFIINSQKICESIGSVEINDNFIDSYTLDFETTTNISYFTVEIKSFVDKFKHISQKQIVNKIDISSYIGEKINITIQAINECGEVMSKSKELLVSNKIDSDNDLLYDDWEIKYFGNLNQLASDDFDSDGVNNLNELKEYINPNNGDTDDDKISDKDDPNPYLNIDNNQNNIADDWEVFYSISDLYLDPDNDGVNSYNEYFLGTNPLIKDNYDKNDDDNDGILNIRDNCPTIANENQIDTDGDLLGNTCDPDDDNDGILDIDEQNYGLNSLDSSDALMDNDGDGYSNLTEIEALTEIDNSSSVPKSLSSVTVEKLGEFIDKDYISLEVENGYVYVLYNEGLKILDTREEDDIKLISFLVLDGYKHSIVKRGHYVYIANGDKGVRIIDIFNKNNPIIIGTFYTGTDSWTGWSQDIDIEGNYAYVSYSGGGALNVVDITDKTAPTLVSKYSDGGMGVVDVDGQYIYVDNFGGERGMSILKLDKNKKPILIGIYTGEASDAYITDIEVKGNYAYVLVNHIGVRILDITDKSQPLIVHTIPISDNLRKAELYGQYLFVTSSNSEGTHIIDVSDKSNPKTLAKFHPYKNSSEMKIEGNKLYIVGGSEGLKVFTTTPKLFGFQDSDKDGYNDDIDIFPNDHNEWLDTDSDGVGNNSDSDDDNDGVPDYNDDFPLNRNEWIDTDNDGTGNNADRDDDNDGISDGDEKKWGFDPLDASDGYNADADNDGVSNQDEIESGSNPLDVNDTKKPKKFAPIIMDELIIMIPFNMRN